jgi:hypothetical protein
VNAIAEANVDAWVASNAQDYYDASAQALYAFTYDHPEYYWIRTSIYYGISKSYGGGKSSSTGYYETSASAYLSIYYDVVPECVGSNNTLISYQSQIDTAVMAIMANVGENWSDVEKLAYFDNWLAANNAYNSSAAADKNALKTNSSPWSILGGLLSSESPVCEGYAKSFQYLCREVGIPCVTVSSDDHMWNAVRLDGRWYYVDCTWDDPVVKSGTTTTSHDYSNRDYFLVTSFGESDSQGSHTINMSKNGFVTPTVSGTGYFTNWSLSNTTFTGSESIDSTGSCWIALYNSSGQLLSCKPCTSFVWSATGNQTTMYLAPDFTADELANAAYAKRFCFDNQWTPDVDAVEIAK